MKAKFYTYRNLNCGAKFSTKHRGIVTERFDTAILRNVELRVSAAGNRRANQERKRNVHAFAVSDNLPEISETSIAVSEEKQIRYNPFHGNSFTINGRPIENAKIVAFQSGRMYLIEE